MSLVLDKTPPSAIALSLSSLLLGLVTGYFLGSGSSIGLFASSRKTSSKYSSALTPKNQKSSWPNSYDVTPFPDSAADEVKLVLVTRTDLGMTKGKIAAQCGHATLACYKALAANPVHRPLLRRWEGSGQPKIALQAKGGQDQLETLQALALSLGLCARVIRDAGRTQIEAGSHG
ncbi:hypothetical protein DV738_g304, partial [Chaetothyriales sp. CBS 135597]